MQPPTDATASALFNSFSEPESQVQCPSPLLKDVSSNVMSRLKSLRRTWMPSVSTSCQRRSEQRTQNFRMGTTLRCGARRMSLIKEDVNWSVWILSGNGNPGYANIYDLTFHSLAFARIFLSDSYQVVRYFHRGYCKAAALSILSAFAFA